MNILIAGIGNIFLGDDGFGVEVAQRMTRRELPQGVDVVDFGIRGLDLSYALLDDGYRAAILVDTAKQGDAPGTLYVIELKMQADADSRVGRTRSTRRTTWMPARYCARSRRWAVIASVSCLSAASLKALVKIRMSKEEWG